jgi:hypothetical protein
MTKLEFQAKITANEELLQKLQSKRRNIDLQIQNLQVRILNQKNALPNFKESEEIGKECKSES